MTDFAILKINSFTLSPGYMTVDFEITTSWNVTRNGLEKVPMDTSANLVMMAKEMVISWVADPANGGKTLTEDDVIVFGGPQ